MRTITTVLFLIALVTASSTHAGASDKDKFDKLVDKYAVKLDDLMAKFSPRALCFPTETPRYIGVLVRASDPTGTPTLECHVPSFNTDGSIVSTSPTTGDLELIIR